MSVDMQALICHFFEIDLRSWTNWLRELLSTTLYSVAISYSSNFSIFLEWYGVVTKHGCRSKLQFE